MSQPAFHQEEREVEVENITLNGEQIPYKKKLAVVFVPPRIVIRLTRPNLDGGPTEWKKCLRFDFLHTWVISNDEAESDKLLVVCGKDRKDKDRYLIKFPNALETEKFLIILKIHGHPDLYKCVAPRLPTTEAELRRVTVDASWSPNSRKPNTMDPLGSINGVNPARGHGAVHLT